MRNYNYPDELYHYGVKGMKWGVRHDRKPLGKRRQKDDGYKTKEGKMWNNKYYSNGHFTKEGKKKFKTVSRYRANYKYDRMLKVMTAVAIAGGIAYLASPAGRQLIVRGKTYFDTKVEPGTLVQTIAPFGRDFSTSFYGSRDLQTRQFFLKKFTQAANPRFNAPPRDYAYLFKNKDTLKIAGRKQMDSVLKDAIADKKAFYTKEAEKLKKNYKELYDKAYNAKNQADREKYIKLAGKALNDHADAVLESQSNDFFGHNITTLRGRDYLWHRYGAFTEDQREFINKQLKAKGYQGFKDYNDISIQWGKTPTVFFGKDSGLEMIKSVKVNVPKAKGLKDPKIRYGEDYMDYLRYSGYTSLFVSSLGGTHAIESMNKNNDAITVYKQPYSDLTKDQKKKINDLQKIGDPTNKKKAINKLKG